MKYFEYRCLTFLTENITMKLKIKVSRSNPDTTLDREVLIFTLFCILNSTYKEVKKKQILRDKKNEQKRCCYTPKQ